MRLAIDANILFAALIKDGLTRRILLERRYHLYAPRYLIEEFSKKMCELEKKTSLTKEVLSQKIEKLIRLSGITVIEEAEFKEFIEESERISPDPKDVPYFALSLKLNCPIWSADKRLKKQGVIRITDTKEMIE